MYAEKQPVFTDRFSRNSLFDSKLFLRCKLQLYLHPQCCRYSYQQFQRRIIAAAFKSRNIASGKSCSSGKLRLCYALHFPTLHILLYDGLPGVFLLHLYQNFLFARQINIIHTISHNLRLLLLPYAYSYVFGLFYILSRTGVRKYNLFCVRT